MPDNKEPKADFSDVEGGSSSTAPPAAPYPHGRQR